MTYTATGFSNPVRVIFEAILHPAAGEDNTEAVARHFRTAIRREIIPKSISSIASFSSRRSSHCAGSRTSFAGCMSGMSTPMQLTFS